MSGLCRRLAHNLAEPTPEKKTLRCGDSNSPVRDNFRDEESTSKHDEV